MNTQHECNLNNKSLFSDALILPEHQLEADCCKLLPVIATSITSKSTTFTTTINYKVFTKNATFIANTNTLAYRTLQNHRLVHCRLISNDVNFLQGHQTYVDDWVVYNMPMSFPGIELIFLSYSDQECGKVYGACRKRGEDQVY